MNQFVRNIVFGRGIVAPETIAADDKAQQRDEVKSGFDAMPVKANSRSASGGMCLPPLLQLILLSLASLPALAQPPATALPTGGTVSAGQAVISQSGSQMQIVQGSDKAALNWQSFDIGSAAGVTFQQPSSQAIALNRVSGADPSQIFGTLNANGKLILINPNGVVFGQGSRVDAAGLIATTKALSDADFMNSNYRFTGGGSGVVRNDGTLVAAPDGAILLVADKVINTGTMQVRGGTIGMVSADQLQVSGDWKTAVAGSLAMADVSDVTIDNLGRIDVSGLQGGQISLKGGNGTTQSGGELLAAGEQGRGGSIHLSGMRVGLLRGSLTDASGASGGGDVLVGGDWQGGGSMEHASATYMDADAVILVNATAQGDGGKAVLWSDGYTNFRGRIEANGAGAGNGGQVETSGKDILDALGSVTARGVQAGNWLLDPSNVRIVSGPDTGTVTYPYNPTAATGMISNGEINAALDNNTVVTISTTNGPAAGVGVGHLVQDANADIVKSTPGEATLRLIASLDLVLNGNITANDGKLNVWLSASGDADNGSGAILVNKDISTNSGTLDFRSGVYTGGTSAQIFRTAGGAVDFKSDLLIVDGLTIDTTGAAGVNGTVTFNGKIDSGDRYSFVSTGTTWIQAEINARNGTGGGSADNDSYLATPLSALQNLVAAREAGFQQAWLGGSSESGQWIWVGGIDKGKVFNTSRAGNNPAPGAYTNWNTSQPDYFNNVETALQFTGLSGKWNDLSPATTLGYVVQTNRPASPLTVNAGTATVTFGGAVGSLKPLDNLLVTGPTVITGGQISTEQGQTYNNGVTIGSGPTLLESTESSLHFITPMKFNQAVTSNLTIRAAEDILLDTPITAENAAVSVAMVAGKTITLNAAVTTGGGAINLTASSGILLNDHALDTGTGAGAITLLNTTSGDIVATGNATMNAGLGNISVTNGETAGIAGSGQISLQDLTGGAITIASNFIDAPAGPAVTLSGPVTGNGAMSIRSVRGNILVNGDISNTGQPVSITANSLNTNVGTITINNPITTTGGSITLTASTGIDLNGQLTTGAGAGDITLVNNVSGDITAAADATMNAGLGNISVTNNGTTGGKIVLQDLEGTGIVVRNNVSGVTTGNAVALNGPLTAAGAVTVSSLSGDILVADAITGAALPVSITADSGNTGNGAITLEKPVTTAGGLISLTASSGITFNDVLNTGGGNMTLLNKVSGDITAAAGATMNAGLGNISVTNNGTAGGKIVLQGLDGTGIHVQNNVSGVTTGNAVTLNGPLTAAGAVTISSLSGDILVDGVIAGGALPVSITADSGNTGNGAITLEKPVTTTGGSITLTASTGIDLNGQLTTGAGAGDITLVNNVSGDITAAADATMNAGFGNISVTNNGTAGGKIALQDLEGTGIIVRNNVSGVTTGNAVALNGPLTAAGAVTVSSLSGDILVDGVIAGGALPVSITADSGNTGNGAITLEKPVTTAGGLISLTASSGITFNDVLNTGGGNMTLLNKVSGDITAAAGATMNAGLGNISVTNNGTAGGKIVLQGLDGTGIHVENNVSGVATGNAVALNGPLTAAGAVTVSSLSGDILVDDVIAGAALPVSITADSGNTGNGAITLEKPVTTTGGSITLTASTGIDLNGALNTGGGNMTLLNKVSGNITAAAGATMNAGNGDISVTNHADSGLISLQDLTGAKITVASESMNLAAGIAAITLNGLVTAGDAVLVTSKTGDIQIDKNITSTVAGNASAIIVAAGTSAGATDSTGGDVKLNGGKLFVDPSSRAIIFSGSLAGTTGLDATFPGAGHYRYNVAYNNTSRIADTTGTYVQFRQQPTLNISLPDKVYDATILDALDWNNYIVINGWLPGDGPGNNPLTGRLVFNQDATVVARNAGNYTIDPAMLSDTLGYKLDFTNSPSFNITPRHITVGDLVVATRQYDSTTDALITGGTLNGVLAADIGNVSLNGTHGQFADKNVGVDKTVLVAHAELSGSEKDNYAVDFGGSSTTGTITPAELRLSGVHPLDRVYDGTTNATFTGTPTLSGIYASDVGRVSAPLEHISGHFANKNAGHNKEVVEDLSTAILFGPEKDNYVIVGVDATVNSATILPAPLQVSGVSTSKMFDGTTDSHTEALVIGLMPGDSVSDVRQYFNNAMPGKGKTLLVPGGFTIDDGNNGNNYIIASNLLVRGEIKGIPTPSGLGANGFSPDSKNLDLLLALTAFENLRQKFEQADYFLYPGEEPKRSSTHAASFDRDR